MIEVKVVDSADAARHGAGPAHATRRARTIDSHPLQLGKDIEIKAAATGRPRDDVDLQGPDRGGRARVHAAGLRDLDPRLRQGAQAQPRSARRARSSRCRPRTWSRKVAGEAGLSPKVTSTSVVHEFFQQSNETDWDFVWRLALMHDFEVVVDDTTLEFRPANKAATARRGRAASGRTA